MDGLVGVLGWWMNGCVGGWLVYCMDGFVCLISEYLYQGK